MASARLLFCGGVLAIAIATACGGQVAGTGPASDGGGASSEAGATGGGDAAAAPEGGSTPEAAYAGFGQMYLMACTSQLTNGDVSEATVYVATATFTPAATGGGGTLDFSYAPLQVGATSLSQTAGPAETQTAVPVAADGTAVIDYGMATVPAAANPLGSGDVIFSSLTLTFQIGPGDDVCANVTGAYSQPIAQAINVPGQNVCVFVPVASVSAPLPTLAQSQVHCP